MTAIDQRALSGADALASQPSLYQQIIDSFQGGSRWLVSASFFAVVLFSALAVFAAVRFFQTEAMSDSIFYATAFLASLLVVAMLKIWYWMELNKSVLRRDIARLEQQLGQARNSVA